MPKLLSAFLIGAVFGLGIAISGMINPAKVLNFFDVAGTWDPSLALVMAGGLAVTIPGYWLIFRSKKRPVLEGSFCFPTFNEIDRRLVGGAALFGTGWGMVGFCPGGAIPAFGLGYSETFLFLAAMIAGILLARMILTRRVPSPA